MSERLKPCPFCGEAPRTEEINWNIDASTDYRMICPGCGATQLPRSSFEDAAKLWNQRAAAASDDGATTKTVTITLAEYERIISERAAFTEQVAMLLGKLHKTNETISSYRRGKTGDDNDD